MDAFDVTVVSRVHDGGRVPGIIATCRALRVPAQAYLTWAFERLGANRERFDLPLEALTPVAFKKSWADQALLPA